MAGTPSGAQYPSRGIAGPKEIVGGPAYNTPAREKRFSPIDLKNVRMYCSRSDGLRLRPYRQRPPVIVFDLLFRPAAPLTPTAPRS